MDLRLLGWLVRVAHAGQCVDLAALRPGVQPLHVARPADLERRVDEYLDESRADHRSHFGARGPVWADEGAHDGSAVANYLGRHEAYSANVLVAVLATETQAAREMRAHHVAVEHGHGPSRCLEQLRDAVGGRRLAGPGEAGEPQAKAGRSGARRGIGAQFASPVSPGELLAR